MAHRLRFAPSPTGYLHVGSARTALFNWLYVKHYGGQFLLRVEDTDRARSTEESTRAIFEGLGWLGLGWDEDVVFQGGNLARHQADTQRLLEADAAYRCFCTPAELDEMRKAAEARGEAFKYDRRCARLDSSEVQRRIADGMPFAIRFRMPEGETSWTDLVHGPIKFANKDIGEGDFIILRSDATPIYNLAVVSDDIAMGITLVMRGDDHISNTPKQILLYRALGATVPEFAHLPMIHGLDGKKLSKRHGATAVGDYRHMGILPEAMLNFLALLGWSPGGDIEVMTVKQMIDAFSVEGLSKNAAVFDTKKLEWMNGQHLSMLSAEELMPTFVQALTTVDPNAPALVSRGALDAGYWIDPTAAEPGLDWLRMLIDLLKVRARTVDDMVRQAAPYLQRDIAYDEDGVAKTWKDPKAAHEILSATRDALADAKPWDAAALEGELRSFAESRGIAAGKLFQPLRLALTGVTASPGIFDVLVLLGRERSLARLDAALAWLAAAGATTDAADATE
ncbi:MAG TPA: glutamate--tRNA ligase [Gemmatimonadaceae bacterium]|jgi:glutamyl-tRNA synthetase|nr:glutamate--tRNA ligase [Gemmatimonadaceae bacterium]